MNELIFLTGLPRSGTKLLRDLMNNNSRISIPRIETVIIPYMINKYGEDFDLSNQANFELISSEFRASPFYYNFSKSGEHIDLEHIRKEGKTANWAHFFEEILKFYGPKKYTNDIYIGDKTPGYIDHTELLSRVWPKAKFIHIVRDPRDYICSVHQVWKKSIYRAASRWNQTMTSLSNKDNLTKNNLLTVYYEDLLNDPQMTLTEICAFINVDFEESMLSLNQSSEKFGDAKGATHVVSTNSKKYKSKLTSNQIYKVEQLVCQGARIHGYQLENPKVAPRELTKLERSLYKLSDGYHALKFHMGNKGLWDGASYFFNLNKVNLKRS